MVMLLQMLPNVGLDWRLSQASCLLFTYSCCASVKGLRNNRRIVMVVVVAAKGVVVAML